MDSAVPTSRPRALRYDLVPLGCALVAFFWPLFYLNRTPGADWAYFDSLSLVVRSSIHNYGRFPLHEPWTSGGTDILANPQSRIFSPFGLFDIIFLPHIANVLSLVVLCACGAWGMKRLLRHLGHDNLLASVGAMMFVAGSWFMLHFCEGHVPYGSMQLLPWTVLGLLRFDERRMQLMLAGLMAFFVLDGGMYAFIFSIYAAIVMLCVGLIPVRRVFDSVRTQPSFLLLTILVALALIAAKVVPVFSSLGTRVLMTEAHTTQGHLWRALYDPDQWFLRMLPRFGWRFHELGCYLGFAATLTFVVGLRDRAFLKAHWRWMVFALVFLWIGAYWLAPFNPWELIRRTPILRNAHVQTRLFVWVYLAWVIIVVGALSTLRRWRWATIAASLVVVLEIVMVSQYQWHRAMQNAGGEERFNATTKLITARKWRYTVQRCGKPAHYFTGGLGCYKTYEPAEPPRGATYRGASDYTGEITVIAGVGSAELYELSPGYIRVRYDGQVPASLRINQNRLFGWEVDEGDATVVNRGLALTVDIGAPGEFVLRYQPWYFSAIVFAYVVGLVGLFVLVRRVRRESVA